MQVFGSLFACDVAEKGCSENLYGRVLYHCVIIFLQRRTISIKEVS